MRIEQLRKHYNIETRWTAFPLHPETPEEGLTLEELFAGRSIDIKKIMLHLKQVADKLGLPLSEREKTYNSRLAQELAKWAGKEGKEDAYHEAVFRAYFVNGKNIGKMNELVAVAKSIGLREQEARSALQLRTFKDDVDSDWRRSLALAITAVPTLVVNHQSLTGFQPYEVLEQFLRTCGGESRNR